MTPALMNDGAAATQEHPEQLPGEETAAVDYGERNERLPAQLVTAIRGAVKDFSAQEQYLRRREVMRDARNRYYERGFQHIYWNQGQGGYAMISAGGLVTGSGGQSVQSPNYVDAYNIFQPNVRILEAILTQNPPGIDFQPINPNLAEDMEAADTAESYRKMFDRSNRVKSIQTKVVRMMCLSSRAIIWTRTEANAQKFGKNEDGSPKKMETATVHGTLESKVPILANSQEESLYCFLYDDPDIKQAKAQYPGQDVRGKSFAEQIKANTSGLGENQYERYSRLGVLQGARGDTATGQAFAHLVTRAHCWLRPAAFTGDKFDEPFTEGGDAGPTTIGQKLLQLFPEGCHAVFVGDVYVGSWAESMDDALVIGFPYEGDGMFRLAIMDPVVIPQDAFNDSRNLTREVWDTGQPSRWIDADETEFEAIAEQRSDPYAIRQKKSAQGKPLEHSFYQEPPPELAPTFVGDMKFLMTDLPQFQLATPPALIGGQMEDNKTASGYAQARAQAMGQLGLVWQSIQYMFSRMYYQAALCASRNPDHSQEIVIPGEGQNTSMKLERLTKGKFGAYPDEDSSFPESTQAKRATMQGIVAMVAQSPIGMQLLEAPDNFREFLKLNGFPELVVPEAEAADMQQFEIEELLQQSPLPPSPEELQAAQIEHAAATIGAQNTGQQEPPPFDPSTLPLAPSVPVNAWDFHQWHANKCQDWLNSAACRRQLAEGNMQGVQNVELHRQAHLKAVAMQPPPPAPPMLGAKPPAIAPPASPIIQSSAMPPGAPGVPTM